MPRFYTALAALFAALTIAACGGSSKPASASTANAQKASLILDFTPNAIHTGIYTALARHYDRSNGIRLQVRIPGESTDAVSLLTAGRVSFAILDIHDLAIADAQGRNLVGIMAIEQRPLASVIAQPRFNSPRQLDGQTIGVTGDPSDLAVLRSVIAGAGGKPASLKTITIGYDAVPDLISGKVAAATAFWNDEGVQLSAQHPPFHVFRVEDFGAPSYPELVVCATRSELKRDPGLARGVVRTLVDGYDYVLKHPLAGEHALESQVTGLSDKAVSQQLAAELPAFLPKGGGAYGALEPSVLNAWAKWEVKFGIVKKKPDVATMFDSAFLPR
ncbi:MAG TPA: ABC transporter substrate-binding protein [Solirubrobacteraceae bacterium]|jgi:ABC-type nitrate/sulfonate/bicarbonate transport system substrate-binding protein|nr:ABC transporter substrate-binding protein [Solirubrobacteraceae bacterium]